MDNTEDINENKLTLSTNIEVKNESFDQKNSYNNKNDLRGKRKYDEENLGLILNTNINNEELGINSTNNNFNNNSMPLFTQNVLAKCFNNSNYCLSIMDYFKKVYYFSHIDFYSSYIQILYCFRPQELNDIARIRKRKYYYYKL